MQSWAAWQDRNARIETVDREAKSGDTVIHGL